ncbi:hypothetical protein [Vibrio cyclitrophicus]|uniref:hypothetical protein n=1 Tax=Vibrio cyclitrophicus TaxID=47951 RepID=UPI00148E607B|nr:hypothetical protein [Vibrio cyclitrophicus]NOH21215.1 hypothetical protein [Vibrio cyclitrophicus]
MKAYFERDDVDRLRTNLKADLLGNSNRSAALDFIEAELSSLENDDEVKKLICDIEKVLSNKFTYTTEDIEEIMEIISPVLFTALYT